MLQPKRLMLAPEVNIAVFSFLLHYAWEFSQVPLFSGMADMNHWDGIKFCTSTALGDAGIAVIAYSATSLAFYNRRWFRKPRFNSEITYVGIGVIVTIFLEKYYTKKDIRWSYSDLMPVMPPFNTGLSPLLKWLIIPPLVLRLARNNVLCMQCGRQFD